MYGLSVKISPTSWESSSFFGKKNCYETLEPFLVSKWLMVIKSFHIDVLLFYAHWVLFIKQVNYQLPNKNRKISMINIGLIISSTKMKKGSNNDNGINTLYSHAIIDRKASVHISPQRNKYPCIGIDVGILIQFISQM